MDDPSQPSTSGDKDEEDVLASSATPLLVDTSGAGGSGAVAPVETQGGRDDSGELGARGAREGGARGVGAGAGRVATSAPLTAGAGTLKRSAVVVKAVSEGGRSTSNSSRGSAAAQPWSSGDSNWSER